MTKTEAKSKDYRQLTDGYSLPREQWMITNTIADMKRGGIDFALVDDTDGKQVWRKNGRGKVAK